MANLSEFEVNESHQGTLGRDNVSDSFTDMYELSNVSQARFPELKDKLGRLNEDLWAILIAKTEDKSEAADKLKGVREGEGL